MARYEAGSTLIPSKVNSITENSVKTKASDALRSIREDMGTPDIMSGKGNEFTAEVISILNENGTIELQNVQSFRARAGHESAGLGRVVIKIRPLEDWPTHIMLPEAPRAGGAPKKGFFNIWEQMYPNATAISAELPAPPIGSKVRIRVDGLGESESFWYVGTLDDKVTVPFIEPPKDAKSAFQPCPPGFFCKPPSGDPINTEGTPWGYAAVSASPQSGLLQKAIVNCAKYRSYQLPEGKGIFVEQFGSAADAKYTGMSSPKEMRKQLQKHGFSYIVLGVAFYGSSVEMLATISFLEPYIKELLSHRIRPFLLGELFGGGAETKSATMVEELTNLLDETGAAGIITRMRSMSSTNPGWTAEWAEQHAADLSAAAAKNNMSVGLLGPGHPGAFPELETSIENLATSVNYVMSEITPNQSMTGQTAIQLILDQSSAQWAGLGYETIFPVFPVFGNGFTHIPAQDTGSPEKTNFAPGQSMPPQYFKNFAKMAGMSEESTSNDGMSTLLINDWANMDVGTNGSWSNYNWSSDRWTVIKSIPITDIYPKTEEEAREKGLPAYLSPDGPLVYLPPIRPLSSPTGFTRPAAVLTGSAMLTYVGPMPPPGETYSGEPDSLEPVETASASAAPNQQEGVPIDTVNPSPGSTPNDVSQIDASEGGTSCQSAWGNANNYLWPDISNMKELGRFTMPEAGRGTIRPVAGTTIGIPGKPGPFSVYSNTRLPPEITEWPTKNGKAPGANAFGERHYWSGSPGINRKPGDRRWGGLSKWSRSNIVSHKQMEKRLNKNNPTKKKDEMAASTDNTTSDMEGSKSRYANPCEMYGGNKVSRANANFIHEFRVIFEIACRVSGYNPGQYVSTEQYKGVKTIAAYVPKGKLSGGRFFAYRSYMNKYNQLKWNSVSNSTPLEEAWEDNNWGKFPKYGVLKLSKANTVGEFKNKFEAARAAYADAMYQGTNADGSLNPKRFGFAFSMHATGCAFDIAPSENWLGSKASKNLHFKFKNPIIWEMTGGYLAKAEYYYDEQSKYHDTYGNKKEYIAKGGAGEGKWASLGINTKKSNIHQVFSYSGGKGYKSKASSTLKKILDGASGPSYAQLLEGVKPGGQYSENLTQKLNEWSQQSGTGYVFFSANLSPKSHIYVVKRSIPLSAVRTHPAFWQTFIRAGWSWGGAWTSCFKDDHHFSRKKLFGHQARAVAGRGPHAEGGYPFVNDRGACDYRPVPFMDLKDPSIMINPTKTLLPVKNGKAFHPSYDPRHDSEFIYIHGIGNFPRDPNSPLMVGGIGKKKSSNPIDPANYPGADFS